MLYAALQKRKLNKNASQGARETERGSKNVCFECVCFVAIFLLCVCSSKSVIRFIECMTTNEMNTMEIKLKLRRI